MIRTHPAPKAPTRLFAYGSLIWKPEIEHIGEQVGLARGWHRAFCFRMTRFRGTPEQPGLMMALDRGGQCSGVLYNLPEDNLERQFGKLFDASSPISRPTACRAGSRSRPPREPRRR
ncbi:gamma-glutamylcyclotransferase [Mesorhizobium sp. M1396]|uniref:gamma-glutamylcyclotransferase n=1 Tax=Mesorhizobium sp. M1396 TaxID=2957095 RepID=UPI0033357922